MNYRMILQYDGGRYQGWQRQKEKTEDTIQGRLEMVLSKQEGKPVHVHGAGRTDAGVHARGQVAHFHSEKVYTAGQINEYLPEDIRILRLEEASPPISQSSECYRQSIWISDFESRPFRCVSETVCLADAGRTGSGSHERGGGLSHRQTRFCRILYQSIQEKIHRPSDIRDPSGRRGRPDLDLVLWEWVFVQYGADPNRYTGSGRHRCHDHGGCDAGAGAKRPEIGGTDGAGPGTFFATGKVRLGGFYAVNGI